MNTLTKALFRPLTAADDSAIAAVIREVSAEYGLTPDKGYSVADPTLDQLSAIYGQPGYGYWLVEHNGKVAGGAGIGKVSGYPQICELQKMYFLAELRGQGVGQQLAKHCIAEAKAAGYQQMYLETTSLLPEALRLYHKLGFKQLAAPIGNTGHDACEIPMLLDID
ncbi:GNAT family N-acetyltransferase [Shewanella yunxiaonensis]|uniref:GNAT family N-acetyltransferase n=1 Tax=Shewanella yunxiaonensis TaxID=2829809 RepID=A0ABX7YWS7_9GAMM|nr:GNAT family N-acetyltransferase [Shewanella yunxiaonensis]QUN06521.1 GNAT family N-acetyltransferase [Shewanella yunxiaonensis]